MKKEIIRIFLLASALLCGGKTFGMLGTHLFVESNTTWSFDIYYTLTSNQNKTMPFRSMGAMKDLGLLNNIKTLAIGGPFATTQLNNVLQTIKQNSLNNYNKDAVLTINATRAGWDYSIRWNHIVSGKNEEIIPTAGKGAEFWLVKSPLLANVLNGDIKEAYQIRPDYQKKAVEICEAIYLNEKDNLCNKLDEACDKLILKSEMERLNMAKKNQLLEGLINEYYKKLEEYRKNGKAK